MGRTYEEIKAYGELINGLQSRFDEGILDQMIKDFIEKHPDESARGIDDDLDLIRHKFIKYIFEYERAIS